jgi:hypothetical protein
MVRARRSAIATCMLAGSLTAGANDFEVVSEEAKIAACLSPSPDRATRLEYPPQSFASKAGGTVKVEMLFVAPDQPPELTVDDDNVVRELSDAVRAHVAQFRLPCLAPGASLRLKQEYVFTPNDGRKVIWSQPRGAAASGTAKTCVTHLGPDARPRWPSGLRNTVGRTQSDSAAVLVQMTFTAADKPPEVVVIGRDPENLFAPSVVSWVSGYRMPCLQDRPVVTRQLFRFRMDGGSTTVLRDVPLQTFLRHTKNASRLPVYFDFTSMGCPFDVRLNYQQPHGRNIVGEIEGSNPARRPFLDWLSGLVLDLRAREENAVLGDSMTISVPCGTLDL